MTTHCLRCSSTRRRLILVTNTASRARFHLYGLCLALVVKAMKPRSRQAVKHAILEQAEAQS